MEDLRGDEEGGYEDVPEPFVRWCAGVSVRQMLTFLCGGCRFTGISFRRWAIGILWEVPPGGDTDKGGQRG